MEDMICLDTGAAVQILRERKNAPAWLQNLHSETAIATTLITLFELYQGVYLGSRIEQELKDIEEMLGYIAVLPLTPFHMQEAARTSVALRKRGISIDIRDLLIGICAREEGYVLKTKNKKHFENIQGLRLIDYTISP